MARANRNDIAIVGIGCRLAPDLSNVEDLWSFLCSGGDAVTEIPADRWDLKKFYADEITAPSKTYMTRGSFLKRNLHEFEPLFFGISPREAEIMDPQQKMLLEVAWEAMEHARIVPGHLSGKKTGVFIGVFAVDAHGHNSSPYNLPSIRDHFAATATPSTMLAARLAHVYDLQGPCMSIDTACSSSLVALHQACRSLVDGETDIGVTGGVNLMLCPQTSMFMSKGHFIARDGRSKSFDTAADGYGRGEGSVVFILKRFADAKRDGDVIHAVVSATGVNHDGRTQFLTSPDAGAQARLMTEVMQRAKVQPHDIGYVETHGTGTPAGDPIETYALSQSIAQHKSERLLIGAIKANLGHTEAIAGVLGTLKAALCLKHQAVPPQPKLETVNPSIHLDEWNLDIPRGGVVSFNPQVPVNFAAVNSFGYGGTNAIAIIRRPDREAGSSQRASRISPSKGAIPFLLTAFTSASLLTMAAEYRKLLTSDVPPRLSDLAYSIARSRTLFRNRLLVMAVDEKDLDAQLADFLSERPSDTAYKAVIESESGRGLVFVFSGVGPQWWGMGRYLLRHAPPRVTELARECDEIFRTLSGYSICEEILRDETASRIDETAILQPGIFIIQVLTVEYLRLQSIVPDAVVGHSMGEVAAAYVSGALTLKDAITVIYHRSRLQATLSGAGRMLAVGLSADAAQKLLSESGLPLHIAAINAPNSCTLAGPEEAVRSFSALCAEAGSFSRVLNVTVPFHSPAMDQIQRNLEKALSGLTPSAPKIPFYSTVYGRMLEDEQKLDSKYWFCNARQPVLFSSAIEQAIGDQFTQFVELSPHPVIGRSLKAIAEVSKTKITFISTLNKQEEEEKSLTRAACHVILHTNRIDWSARTGGTLIDLPTYCWTREEYWLESERERRFRLGGGGHPLLGYDTLTADKSWVVNLTELSVPWLKDHCIDNLTLMPAAGFIESALAVGEAIEGNNGLILEDLELSAPLVIQQGENPVLQLSYDDTRNTLRFFSAKEEYSELWTEHGHVKIISAAVWSMPELDLDLIEKHLSAGYSGADLYEQIKEHGFQYGASFQTLRQYHVDGLTAYASVSLSEDASRAEAEAYLLHPALLDGAMHALLALVPAEFDNRLYVPVGFDRLSCFGRGYTDLLVKAEIGTISESQIQATLWIYDTSGNPVAEIKGLRFVEVPRIQKATTEVVENALYYTKWIESEASILFAEPRTILLVGHKSGVSRTLSKILSENGVRILSAPRSGPINGDTLGLEATDVPDAIVYLTAAQKEVSLDPMVTEIMRLAHFGQRLDFKASERPIDFVCVTENACGTDDPESELGSTALSPSAAALAGFFKGFIAENPDLRGKLIDSERLKGDGVLECLAAEILNVDQETEVALRDARRFIPRFVPIDRSPERPLADLRGAPGIMLEKSRTGTLDGLYYSAFDVPPPGRGEITVRILATALNFKDILKGISALPEKFLQNSFHGTHMGMECAFEVIAVGKGVKRFKVGEKYLTCYPGCFRSHMTIPVKGFRAISLDLFSKGGQPVNVEDVAGIPIALTTVLYTLHELARLKKGETLLVHSAAGGVGLAAVEIAKIIGARVFATAGNEEKRHFLLERGCEGVWDSRTLAFYDGILDATGGKGVDVVLNSLTGEAQAHSIALLRNAGRFIEIGKKDIWEKRDISLGAFNGNVAFHSFDLDLMMAQDHRKTATLFDRVPGLARKYDSVILPYKVFPASQTREAFKMMSAAKHIGKILISYEDFSEAHAIRQPVNPIDPDASYLITGGLGGLGLTTAEWIVAAGGRTLHLMGRTPRKDTDTMTRLKRLRATGAKLIVHYGDVSIREDVRTVIEAIKQTNKPLKGVFHAAGVLDDRLIPTLTAESLETVLKPKMLGSHYLDELTRDVSLDYFVLYSSIVTVLSNIGQSSYMAANSWLDALACSRRAAGYPAVSIQWGPIADVGMLAKEDGVVQFFERAGFRLQPGLEALSNLPTIINHDRGTVASMAIEWETCFSQHGHIERNPKFALIRREKAIKNTSAQKLAHLQRVSPDERYEFILGNVKTILGQVLKLDPEGIDAGVRPNELGVDSLAGVEIQTAIKAELGVEISLLVLSRNEPIREIAKNVLRQINASMVAGS